MIQRTLGPIERGASKILEDLKKEREDAQKMVYRLYCQ